ncbi:MAG: hypothetical protein WC483_01570 [Candidatus Paceibacterota bacterium]
MVSNDKKEKPVTVSLPPPDPELRVELRKTAEPVTPLPPPDPELKLIARHSKNNVSEKG